MPPVPCEVCGDPTTSAYRVCQRTAECRRTHRGRIRAADPESGREYQRRRYAANIDAMRAEQRLRHAAKRVEKREACEVCGRLSRSLLGVCQETPECRTEYNRRFREANRPDIREAKRRSRQANLERERERDRRRFAENREARLALQARIRAANPEAVRERNRRYFARTDRLCRYAGCTEYAIPNNHACRDHAAADEKRRARTTRVVLAEAQDWVCTWCHRELPRDLTNVHVDHVIPVSAGGPSRRWNLELLHGPCNLTKRAKITVRARELAAAHGIVLAA
jgi:hypothetical protein